MTPRTGSPPPMPPPNSKAERQGRGTWCPRRRWRRARRFRTGPPPPRRARLCRRGFLLAGEPRRLTLSVTSPRARYFAIPRSALIEVLNEDDAARAREFRERRARVAGAARAAASDIFSKDLDQRSFPTSETSDWDDSASDVSRVSRVSRWAAEAKAAETEARLADAESRALRAHAKASRSSPPEPSPREALFFAEARRAARDAFPFFFDSLAEDDPEKVALLEARARRARVTAHALGMGPPVGLYAARDRHLFPWTRGWRDGGWRVPLGPFAGRVRVGPRDQHARRAAGLDTDDANENEKRRWLLAGVLPGGPGPLRARGAALGAARVGRRGGPRPSARMPRPAQGALGRGDAARPRLLRRQTVTCANETGGMYTDDGTDTEKSRNLSGRSLVSAEKKKRPRGGSFRRGSVRRLRGGAFKKPSPVNSTAAEGGGGRWASRTARRTRRALSDQTRALLRRARRRRLGRRVSRRRRVRGTLARRRGRRGAFGDEASRRRRTPGRDAHVDRVQARERGDGRDWFADGVGDGDPPSGVARGDRSPARDPRCDRDVRGATGNVRETFVDVRRVSERPPNVPREKSRSKPPPRARAPRRRRRGALRERAARVAARAAETVLAQLRRRNTPMRWREGVDAFRAAALGVAGAAEADEADSTKSHSTKEERGEKFARGVPDAA